MPIINSHLATVRVWGRTNLRSARQGIPEKLTSHRQGTFVRLHHDIVFIGDSNRKPEKNSRWRTSPFGTSCWLCTQSDLARD